MLEVKKYGNFKSLGKQKTKSQITLCHTSREVDRYLASLQFRYNGKYDKIPHFIITKDGKILQLLPELGYSNFLSNQNANKNSIFISFENLGWVEKKPLSQEYINWEGSIYNGKVYEKKWRDFFFWDPYTDEQIEQASKLCGQLIENLKIRKRCVGHNTKVEGAEDFEGITSKSNYDQRYTDLNPSFRFENFIKLIDNEQFA